MLIKSSRLHSLLVDNNLSCSYSPGTDEPIECPIGTFRPSVLGMKVSDCQNCTGGKHCNTTGLVHPTGDCKPGFFCPIGSSTESQIICPAGYYCPLGTEYPQECPIGRASNKTGLAAPNQCPSCPKGFYCSTTKLTSPSGPCTAGYYCPTGSSSDKAEPCPSAMHCPTGSAEPQFCPDGNYTGWPLASSCLTCPPGYYCISKNVVASKYIVSNLENLILLLVMVPLEPYVVYIFII